MRSKIQWIVISLLTLLTPWAHAGFVEVGASANYRSSKYNPTNYVEGLTYTTSVSYYFWDMCAWELNYTWGYSKQVSQGNVKTDPKDTIEDNIQLISLDLVLSFAERTDMFRPYVKIGGGYLKKERFRQINDDNVDKIETKEGLVPSGGLGFSLGITKELSIKFGLDAWTSPLKKKEPLVVDYAGRAGVSWMF
jgi:outer membrane protein W